MADQEAYMLKACELTLKQRRFGPVSLQIGTGEMVLLCGRSGSGKSTLCQLLTKTREPSTGSIEVHTPIGYVAHDFENQLIGATVADELDLGDRLGVSVWPELAQALRRLEEPLSGLAGRDPQSLSGALQQHLLVASLVRGGARLLLLDESVSHLDPRVRVTFMDALSLLVQAGLTVVLVSHQVELLEYVDRVLAMESGKAFFDGPTEAFTAVEQHRSGFRVQEEPFPAPSVDPACRSDEVSVLFSSSGIELKAGGCLVIGGWSGAGGSRVLNALFGIGEAEDWQLQTTTESVHHCLLRQHVAPSFWRASCGEELKVSRGAARKPPEALERLVMEALPASWLDEPPWHLSHGQLRFFGASCLLLQYPKILWLDQVFQGLDGPLRAAMQLSIGCFLENGGRVIMTSHDPEEVQRIGHRAVWLENGKAVWWGPGDDLLGDGASLIGALPSAGR